MTVKQKLLLLIFIAATLSVAQSIVTYVVGKQAESIQSDIESSLVKLQMAETMKFEISQRHKFQRDLLLATTPNAIKISKDNLYASIDINRNIMEQLANLPKDTTEQHAYDSLMALSADSYLGLSSFIALVEDEFTEEAQEYLYDSEFSQTVDRFFKIFDDLATHAHERIAQRQSDALMAQANLNSLTIGLMVLGLILLLITGYVIGHSIEKRLIALRKFAHQLVKTGDFSLETHIDGKDEIADVAESVNHLVKNVNMVITCVNEVMHDLSNGEFNKRVIAPAVGDLNKLKTGVNDSVTQISRLLEQLEVLAQQLSQGITQTNIQGDFKGHFAEIKNKLNDSAFMLNSMVLDLDDAMLAMAKGHFARRLQSEVFGDFEALKHSINHTFDHIDSFVTELSQVQALQSSGNLTGRVEGYYAGMMAGLKDAINNAQSNLIAILYQVAHASEKLELTATGIAAASEGLASRFGDQLAQMSTSAQALTLLVDDINHSSSQASTAKQATFDVEHEVSQGIQVMSDTEMSMIQISDSSKRIEEITQLIDSIAFQTNLLALNAAVEAARAGEHGRGFAVVAGEVRSLAQKSASAAGEIKSLIDETTRRVQEGESNVARMSQTLNGIQQSIQSVSIVADELASNAHSQANNANQVNQTVQTLETQTRDNVAGIHNTRDSSQTLKQLAQSLSTSVDKFELPQLSARETAVLKAKSILIDADIAMDFDFVKNAHRAWKAKIRAFLEGKDIGVTYDIATDPTKCALGQWYYGDGQQFSQLHVMQILGEQHAAMHKTIGLIMDAQAVQDDDAVERGLEQMDQFSEQVIELLDTLQIELSQQV